MSEKIKYPSETKVSLKIDSFENGLNTSKDDYLTNMNYATNLYNFSFLDGALKPGLGFCDLFDKILSIEECNQIKKDLTSIGSIERVFHFYIFNQEKQIRDDKLIFVNYEKKMYYINLYAQTKQLLHLRNVLFTKTPNAVRYRLNGEDVMIFTSEADSMVVWNGYNEPYVVLDAPKISSMAIHHERLFATVDGEKTAVWFSDDLDPTNWSLSLNEAGFIELIDERGALLKVVSFYDYLYIFREHGISKLSGYGAQENFSVSNLFVSSGEIFADSVCVCGDEIIFLASDGLYKFDGINTVKILNNIENNLLGIKPQKVSACYLDGNYYLACKFNFLDDEDDLINKFHSNTLLEIDISKHKIKNISHGLNIKNITTIATDKLSGIIVLANKSELESFIPTILDKSGKFLNKPLNKVWQSPKTYVNDFDKQKTLKTIKIHSSNDLKLTLFHDNHITEYYIVGSNNLINKKTNLICNVFGFKIESESFDCNIKDIEFEFFSTYKNL